MKMKDESADFSHFDLKLVAMATSLERSGKGGQIDNRRSNTYHMVKMVKMGPVDLRSLCSKVVHPSSICSLATFVLQCHYTARHWGTSSVFSVAITAEFTVTCMLEGVTATPRGLHARLCHAFLV